MNPILKGWLAVLATAVLVYGPVIYLMTGG